MGQAGGLPHCEYLVDWILVRELYFIAFCGFLATIDLAILA